MVQSTARAWVALLTCAYCISAARNPEALARKMDSAWKLYLNRELGFCVEYPARWVRASAFEGDGMYFETGVKKFSLPIAEIDVAMLRDPVASGKDYIQLHLAGLQKFERAQQLELLETKSVELRDVSGWLSRNRYLDPQDGHPWMDEIAILRDAHSSHVYRVELECRAEKAERFERVFARMLNSFEATCNQSHPVVRQ